MINQNLMEKWKPVIEHDKLPRIDNAHKAAVTAVLLENTEKAVAEGSSYAPQSLLEAGPTNSAGTGGFTGSAAAGGPVAGYDPVLVSLVRRAMPNLIAYDIAGVQALSGPTGLIFAMRSRYDNQSGAEAFYNEANTQFSGNTDANAAAHVGTTGLDVGNTDIFDTGEGFDTGDAERLGGGGAGDGDFNEMAFTIEKVTASVRSRALKAEYSTELAQDMKAIHGLNAENELANMLTTELLNEINRHTVRTIYRVAKAGSQEGVATAGRFNLDVDSNGRWLVEKFKGLMFQIEREANQIAKDTRRGKGNLIICSSNVASALNMAGLLDHTPALNSNNLSVDDTGTTFAGVLNGRYRVYIDPYASADFMVVGYKGSNAFDAGLFYCPYVPLQMVRAVGENSFQSKLGFKTRYAMVANPYAQGAAASASWTRQDGLDTSSNVYYRRTLIQNLL